MFTLKLLIGPSSTGLGNNLKNLLKLDTINLEWKIFPDGESYFRLLSKVDNTVILVHSISPPQDKRLMELFFLIKLLIDNNVENIILVIPYLAYMRQDKRFLDGEVISIEVIGKLLKSFNINNYVFVDVHSDEVFKFFNGKIMETSAFPLIADFLSRNMFKNPLVLAPDYKALKYAETMARKLRTDYDYIEKRRDKITGIVESDFKEINVRDRDIILVDDIISTGGTIVNATRILRNLGANRIWACCAHGIFIGNAINNMFNAGVNDIISTDTIESYYSRVSVAPGIASAIRSLVE